MTNDWVVVTGDYGHIGSNLVRRFVESGTSVIGLDHPGAAQARATSALRSGNHYKHRAVDLSNPEAVDAVVREIAQMGVSVKALINNASVTNAVGESEQLQDASARWDDFLTSLKVGVIAPWELSRQLASHLRRHASPTIVNVSSIYGLVAPRPSLYHDTVMSLPASYAATKGALVQLTRYMASYFAPEIRVNAVAPGGVYRGQPEVFVQRYESLTPLGRMCREEDVTDAIAWLTNAQSSFVTGQVLAIDGGWTSQ